MRRRQYPKSGLFLLELLINLLLFCFLCGCGLMFFMKSYNLTHDATCLHNAVRIASSVAGIYETGDGSLTPLCNVFSDADRTGDTLSIYFDEEYNPCEKELSVYYILITETDTTPAKIRIDFYDSDGETAYSIEAYNYTSSTLGTVKEVAAP